MLPGYLCEVDRVCMNAFEAPLGADGSPLDEIRMLFLESSDEELKWPKYQSQVSQGYM
jgi:hypothetical protein